MKNRMRANQEMREDLVALTAALSIFAPDPTGEKVRFAGLRQHNSP